VAGEQRGQPGQVTAVQDVAAVHFQLELGPAGEAVLAGQRQLGRGQADPVAGGADPRDRAGLAVPGGVQQVFGLVPKLVKVGPGRQVRHDVSLMTRGPRPGRQAASRSTA
jgi:hypothetical protein